MNKRKRKNDDEEEEDFEKNGESFRTCLKTSSFEFEWEIDEFDKIFPSKTTVKSEDFSNKQNPHFRWNFSLALTDEECGANSMAGRKKFLNVKLHCLDSNESFVKLELTFHILNNEGAKGYNKTLIDDSPAESKSYGFEKFISLDNLIHSKNIFLSNNSLKLSIEINLNHFVNVPRNPENSCEQSERRIPGTPLKRSDLSFLYRNPDYCDLTLVCEDVRILVHKCILAAKSEVFDRKLKKLQGDELTLPIPLATVQELLAFIYTGNCPNLQQYAEDLYDAAVNAKISGLKDLAENSLSDTITLENVFERLVWAETWKAQILKKSAFKFINKNFKNLCQTVAFQTFIEDHPKLTKELICDYFQTETKAES